MLPTKCQQSGIISSVKLIFSDRLTSILRFQRFQSCILVGLVENGVIGWGRNLLCRFLFFFVSFLFNLMPFILLWSATTWTLRDSLVRSYFLALSSVRHWKSISEAEIDEDPLRWAFFVLFFLLLCFFLLLHYLIEALLLARTSTTSSSFVRSLKILFGRKSRERSDIWTVGQ